jgi:uncharacterized protein
VQPKEGNPEVEAAAFVDTEKGVPDARTALAGACDIVAEVFAETAPVRALVREVHAKEGFVTAQAVPEKTTEPTKFEQYYDFKELVASIPSHRYLAIRRGEREEVLRVRIEVDGDALLPKLLRLMSHDPASPFGELLDNAVRDGYKRLLAPSVETDIRVELKERSDRAAIDVFADNLRTLLLAPPLGGKPVVGIDPGIRTGCKCAAIDETGKVLGHTTLFISQGENQSQRAGHALVTLVEQLQPFAVAVGNGTGGREAKRSCATPSRLPIRLMSSWFPSTRPEPRSTAPPRWPAMKFPTST